MYASAKELKALWGVTRLPKMEGVPKIIVPCRTGSGCERVFVFEDPREPLRTGRKFSMNTAERKVLALTPDHHVSILIALLLFLGRPGPRRRKKTRHDFKCFRCLAPCTNYPKNNYVVVLPFAKTLWEATRTTPELEQQTYRKFGQLATS